MYFYGTLSSALNAASNIVLGLQQQLAQLSFASGDVAANPNVADGVVGPSTVSALSEALRLISAKVPSTELKLSVAALSVAMLTAPDAASWVTDNAVAVSAALSAAMSAFTLAPAPAGPTGPAWYQTAAGQNVLFALAGVAVVAAVLHHHYRETP